MRFSKRWLGEKDDETKKATQLRWFYLIPAGSMMFTVFILATSPNNIIGLAETLIGGVMTMTSYIIVTSIVNKKEEAMNKK